MTRTRACTDTTWDKNALLQGLIATSLLLCALPTLGSSILQSANGSIDAMWIGQLLGGDVIAATTNGNLVMFLLTAFVFGFGMGVVFNLILTGGLIVLVLFTDRQVLSLFLADDGQTMVIAQHILKLGTWGFLAFGVSMVLFGAVRGNGQVVWPLIILLVSLYPIRIGLAYGVRDWLGADALWWSFPVSLTATMFMAIILYVHGGWRRPQGLNFDASTEEISVSNPNGICGATVHSTIRRCLSRNGVTK